MIENINHAEVNSEKAENKPTKIFKNPFIYLRNQQTTGA